MHGVNLGNFWKKVVQMATESTKKPITSGKSDKVLKGLLKMAKRYGVEKNELFLTAVNQYVLQQQIIQQIRDEIATGTLLTSKEYVKGRENIYVNPLVKELPKHSDAANKTAGKMLDIIKQLGNAAPAKAVDPLLSAMADIVQGIDNGTDNK